MAGLEPFRGLSKISATRLQIPLSAGRWTLAMAVTSASSATLPLLREGALASCLAAAREAAVLVHYRGIDDTLAAIRSIHAEDPNLPIVVVDNDSGDRLDAVAAEPSTFILQAPGNGGFGAGCNLGFDRLVPVAKDLERVLLLNPDARLEPGALDALRACAYRHPDAGIVGARIRSFSGELLYENGHYNPWLLTRMHRRAKTSAREYPTEFVTGAAMWIDADLLRGGLRFDPEYFMYGEDLQLCRDVIGRGRSLWVTREAEIRHGDGGSWERQEPVLGDLGARRLYWLTRSKARFARRNLSWLQRTVFFTVAWLAKPIAGLVLERNGAFLRPYFRGLRDGR